jgi:hypothetical protein
VRYAAKLCGGGLYPEDPWEAALADQACYQADDAAMVSALAGALAGCAGRRGRCLVRVHGARHWRRCCRRCRAYRAAQVQRGHITAAH